MNTVQRIAKNTGVLLASQIASYIIGFFFIMYQTLRKFDQNASFALAFTGIFGVFSDLGLSTLTVREVARDNYKTQ
jgi:O-antigen/teichoic acid export membrane protein